MKQVQQAFSYRTKEKIVVQKRKDKSLLVQFSFSTIPVEMSQKYFDKHISELQYDISYV